MLCSKELQLARIAEFVPDRVEITVAKEENVCY
jgi:hypothetical protein